MSGCNIETEYLELNAKNEWPALYQVILIIIGLLYAARFVIRLGKLFLGVIYNYVKYAVNYVFLLIHMSHERYPAYDWDYFFRESGRKVQEAVTHA